MFTNFADRWCVPVRNHQINFIRDKVVRDVRLFLKWTASIHLLERAFATRDRILVAGFKDNEDFMCHRIIRILCQYTF